METETDLSQISQLVESLAAMDFEKEDVQKVSDLAILVKIALQVLFLKPRF